MESVKNMENVELEVLNTSKTRFYFSDYTNLRCKKIKNIDIPSVADVTVSPTGKNVINATVYAKSFLVLSIEGREKVNRIPLKSLNPYSNYGRRIDLSDLPVDWTKSYIEVGSIESLALNEVFYLNVFY